MDYTQLTAPKGTPGSIASWVNSSRIVNDTPEIVLEAESWIYRRLKHWRMLSLPYTGVFTVSSPIIPLPVDCLEPAFFCITGVQKATIYQRTFQETIASYDYDGSGNRVAQQPRIYYFDKQNLNFNSPADQAYPFLMLYYQQPAPLAQTVTNFLTATYPRLMRLCCMAGACEWEKDSGQGQYDRTYWDQLAQDEIEVAQKESDRAQRATIAAAIEIGAGDAVNFPFNTSGY